MSESMNAVLAEMTILFNPPANHLTLKYNNTYPSLKIFYIYPHDRTCWRDLETSFHLGRDDGHPLHRLSAFQQPTNICIAPVLKKTCKLTDHN